MHVDLVTFYLLAIGTLFASSGMTLWELRVHPERSRELKIFATGYATLAIGCAVAAFRHYLPGATGAALSNLTIFCGYLLILHGAASLNGRQYRVASLGLLLIVALSWVIGGVRWPTLVWDYFSSFPIAVVCGMTSRELFRRDGTKRLQSRRIAALMSGVHASFYAFRAFVLPWLALLFGQGILPVLAKITMYEGVLYSVILPMTLLRFIREEAHDRLLQESQTDFLTGLGNRRRFFEESTRVLRDNDLSRPVSLLAFDLDHFKKINDRYGHEAGDEVLKSFAKIARDAVGAGTILARIGGEEFAALLPGYDGAHAKEVGEAVVTRFAETISYRTGGVTVQGTVSVGLAQSSSEQITLTALLASADQALYSAKSLGGNRVELAQNGAHPRSFASGIVRRNTSEV
jgi:diguanylate cyclase (GGDEF)-like protein